MTKQPLIHLVDDDDAIRHSASFMLRHAGFRVETHVDGVAFLDGIEDAEHGCVLLDVQMPVMDGLAVQDVLNEKGISMPVIVLTGHGDINVAVRAMKAGAVDFVEKPYEKTILLSALNKAFKDIESRSPREKLEAEASSRLSNLTPREMDILTGLVEGLTNKGVAKKLNISPRTVEIHRANMMDKLQVNSLSEALRLAFAAGIGLSSDN